MENTSSFFFIISIIHISLCLITPCLINKNIWTLFWTNIFMLQDVRDYYY